ncbi:hypothetical protein [Antarctobacter jejuensis]|uniref:hypothetical protein n=1 Tax=Antarctobacter jejuensis TaxID=1439938 RepID=UPI003FD2B8FF
MSTAAATVLILAAVVFLCLIGWLIFRVEKATRPGDTKGRGDGGAVTPVLGGDSPRNANDDKEPSFWSGLFGGDGGGSDGGGGGGDGGGG